MASEKKPSVKVRVCSIWIPSSLDATVSHAPSKSCPCKNGTNNIQMAISDFFMVKCFSSKIKKSCCFIAKQQLLPINRLVFRAFLGTRQYLWPRLRLNFGSALWRCCILSTKLWRWGLLSTCHQDLVSYSLPIQGFFCRKHLLKLDRSYVGRP